MTTQSDAVLNTDNPLRLRSSQYGGYAMTWSENDANFLNLQRWAGAWAARTHLKNEIVWHRGGAWIALSDTTDEPGSTAGWQALVGPMGRGEMGITAANPRADLGVAWQDIDVYDSSSLSAVGCTLTLATGHVSFSYPGLWQLSFALSLSHNSLNTGRTTSVRMFNVTTQQQIGNPFLIGIGRNVEQSSITMPLLLPISIASIGDDISFQIGNGSTITSVEFTSQSLSLAQIHYT